MFKLNTIVSIRPILENFHYVQTPVASLESVLKKLQKNGAIGKITRLDLEKHAVGVLFPRMNDILWFKTYELQTNRNGR